jgi:hypothetical protein
MNDNVSHKPTWGAVIRTLLAMLILGVASVVLLDRLDVPLTLNYMFSTVLDCIVGYIGLGTL